MSIWDTYPATYRNHEVNAIVSAARAGECMAIAGLSGSGKSNLLGFLSHRLALPGTAHPHPMFILVDCNRLASDSLDEFFGLVITALGVPPSTQDSFTQVEHALRQILPGVPGLCLMFDRFDALGSATLPSLSGRLRALRDAFKYDLTYVIASRRAPKQHTELAELFYSNTIWLGRLSLEDALWSASQFAQRKNLSWEPEILQELVSLSQGYASFLRASCEAFAAGASLDLAGLLAHPIVQKRLDEFWADQPGLTELAACGLLDHPFLAGRSAVQPAADPLAAQLTAKEHLLWQYFQAHPSLVCEKDDLIRAVWPEDRIFERGVRDDSLAQLIRRLREKVEDNPSEPVHIHTIPGRGYRFIP